MAENHKTIAPIHNRSLLVKNTGKCDSNVYKIIIKLFHLLNRTVMWYKLSFG